MSGGTEVGDGEEGVGGGAVKGGTREGMRGGRGRKRCGVKGLVFAEDALEGGAREP